MAQSGTASTAPARYTFGPFVLDAANRRLLRDGAPVGITARVFDILVALVECHGQAVEKDTLISRVWGDVAVEEGNLARAVSTLRKILGESPDDPRYIVTLPGRGYQFVGAVGVVEPETTAITAPRATGVGWRLAAAAVVLVAAAGALWMQRDTAPSEPPRIVVLPFKNLGSPGEEYVSAGITEEITSRLAAIQSLRVVSRTTASRYERSGKGAREIGADLGADYLLEGSVLWEQRPRPVDRVRITAQLIRVADDTHAWTETFDRDVADLFNVQSEIAVRVVRELRSTMLGTERAALAAPPTKNLEAYRWYLQGVFSASRPDFSEDAMAATIRNLQRAVDLDPGFAKAQAALALAQVSFYQFGHDISRDRLELARQALERARELGPDLPETSRAQVNFWLAVRPDPHEARAAIAAAERRHPHDPNVLSGTAGVLLRLGQWDEAATRLTRARDLDPKNPFVHAQLALVMTGLRRYADAQRGIEQSLTLERDQQLAYIVQIWTTWMSKGDLATSRALLERLPQPDDWRFMELRFNQSLYERRFDDATRVSAPWSGRWMRTWVLVRPAVLLEAQAWRLAGNSANAARTFEAARALLEPEVRASAGDGRLRSSLGLAYAGLGRDDEARREAQRALELMPFASGFDTTVVREDVALIYTMIGDREAALRQVEILLSTPAHFSTHLLRLDPRWDPLRGAPRYQQLIAAPTP